MSFIAHLERHLGVLTGGWKSVDSGFPVVVAHFADMPVPMATTFVTLGLSDNPLSLPQGRQVRKEIVTCADSNDDTTRVAAMLAGVSEAVHDRGQALLRGEVFGPGNPVVQGSALRHLYVTSPSFLMDPVIEYAETDPPTILAWVIPISDAESSFVARHGWRDFELLLESADPDLFDFNRSSLVPDG